MKKLLLILFILIAFKSNACECMGVEKDKVSEFKNDVDYIVIGTVVDQLNPYKIDWIDYKWKSDKEAFDVVVKVKKIIKGEISIDTLFITQDNSNCSKIFELGKDYIFTGKEIKKFVDTEKNNDPVDFQKSDQEIDSDPIPDSEITSDSPYQLYRLENGVLYHDFLDNARPWNELLKEHRMILTNQCYSAEIDSEFAKIIIN